MQLLLIVGSSGLLNLKRADIIAAEETNWSELLRKKYIEYIDVMEVLRHTAWEKKKYLTLDI